VLVFDDNLVAMIAERIEKKGIQHRYEFNPNEVIKLLRGIYPVAYFLAKAQGKESITPEEVDALLDGGNYSTTIK